MYTCLRMLLGLVVALIRLARMEPTVVLVLDEASLRLCRTDPSRRTNPALSGRNHPRSCRVVQSGRNRTDFAELAPSLAHSAPSLVDTVLRIGRAEPEHGRLCLLWRAHRAPPRRVVRPPPRSPAEARWLEVQRARDGAMWHAPPRPLVRACTAEAQRVELPLAAGAPIEVALPPGLSAAEAAPLLGPLAEAPGH